MDIQLILKLTSKALLLQKMANIISRGRYILKIFFRFEGDSDPADNSILYVVETNDGTKGTLIDAYGPYADPKVSKFMQQVDDIQKKTEKS